MKRSKIFISSLLLVTLMSCKNEKTNENNSDRVKVEAPKLDKNIFTVTLNAIVKKDDSFQLYYKNDDKENFEDKKSLFTEFKGSENPQDIVFKLPQDELPYYLRLDFGVNKEQPQIIIKSLRIDYLDKKVEIKGEDYFNYFYGNDLTEKIDSKQGIITPILTKEGNYDPMTASAEGLRKQIEVLIK